MPSDSNGVYSLPPGYLATDGDTIQASQHNPPLEDIASAMTSRLPRNGNAPMVGPLKVPDGTVGAPSLTFSSAPTVGFYKTTNGIGVSVNGVQVFEFAALTRTRLIGEIVDWTTTTAPTGWLACQGQLISTTTYSELFALIAYTYGGTGASFRLPDLRCTVTAGYDTGRSILTGASVLGALLGAQSQPIGQTHLPPLTWPNSLGISDTRTWQAGDGTALIANKAGSSFGGGASGGLVSAAVTQVGGSISLTGGVTSGGSGTALPTVQPTTILNKIIFTGVA